MQVKDRTLDPLATSQVQFGNALEVGKHHVTHEAFRTQSFTSCAQMTQPVVPIKMLEKGVTKKPVDPLPGKIRKRVQIENEIGRLGRLNVDIGEIVKPLMPTTEVIKRHLFFPSPRVTCKGTARCPNRCPGVNSGAVASCCRSYQSKRRSPLDAALPLTSETSHVAHVNRAQELRTTVVADALPRP